MPEPARHAPGARVAVLLPLPLVGAYDYRVPPGPGLADGDIVEIPLGRRRATGVVWGAGGGSVAGARLKEVARRLDAPTLPAPVRRFVDWVAAYTLAPPGAVLRMAISVPEALAPPATQAAFVVAAPPAGLKLTPERRRVLACAAGPPRPAAELAREAACGVAVVRALVESGALARVELAPPPPPVPDWRRAGPALSPDQAAAAAELEARVASGTFSVAVLDGVPGSGKTEVYFQAVAAALARGRQALVLLPEIALGAQWLDRFRRRFGCEPVVWHSDLGQRTRRANWRAVAEGTARVVVGARSALFLPFAELGVVVVDEEHDAAFKQEEGVIYNARDMAVVRARIAGVPAVLVSATPSLETVVNVEDGRYRALHLPDRHAGAILPRVTLVDMRKDGPEGARWISAPLKEALAATLADGEQALLFLNRRGYAPLTLCRACGHRLGCPRCTAWLVAHRGAGGERLVCHHCGFNARAPAACPNCATEGSLAACGPGVERVAEEVAGLYPAARLAIAASDTLVGPAAAEALVERILAREVDLIVGTQIVAKGHHFPLLTLVGVVDADLGLVGGDLRAAERTYQLLYQVAGRAGRAERPGRVLVQTYMPEHPVMAALAGGGREAFLAAESEARRVAAMPPFGRLAALIVSGPDEAAVDAAAAALGRAAPRAEGVTVLGPAPAPFALLRGRHRRRLLLKARRDVGVQPLIRRWLAAAPVSGRVRVQVDVDPMSFL